MVGRGSIAISLAGIQRLSPSTFATLHLGAGLLRTIKSHHVLVEVLIKHSHPEEGCVGA